jgi:predicted ArsR family transcriptional regulator
MRIQKETTQDTASAIKRSESSRSASQRHLDSLLKRGDVVVETWDNGGRLRTLTIETRRDLPYRERTRLLALAAEAAQP